MKIDNQTTGKIKFDTKMDDSTETKLSNYFKNLKLKVKKKTLKQSSTQIQLD